MDIKKELQNRANEQYRQFSASLLPGVTRPLIGVRMPELRKMAGLLVRTSWTDALDRLTDDSFEEILLRGFVIADAPVSINAQILLIEAFLPKIDNWAICDSFCSSLKTARKEPEIFWNFIRPLFTDSAEFKVRFAVVLLLNFFLSPSKLDEAFQMLAAVRHSGYYARTAVAWALSCCYFIDRKKTLSFLDRSETEIALYRASIQKIRESLKIDPLEKAQLKQRVEKRIAESNKK